MNQLNLAENLVRFRHERKVTQEQLADFIGVTKASVSKWETRQSSPDIMILPQLAAFFGITVDELIGYSPQLSKEQIQKLYQKFAADFAVRPFGEVMQETRTYVKQYYSCYPFLLQICVLWLNHYMLAGEPAKQAEVMAELNGLCDHIKKDCQDVKLCSDVISLQAASYLMMGKAQEVIDSLENLLQPYRPIQQNEAILSQAYIQKGDLNRAESFVQICMYDCLLSLLGFAGRYLTVQMNDPHICEETIRRAEQVIKAYELNRLHPNCTAGFEYQSAICYAAFRKKKKALEHLANFVFCIEELFAPEKLLLHGDDYFTRIEEVFEQLDSFGTAPRSRELVREELFRYLEHPSFAVLDGEPEFTRLKNRLKEIR